MLSYRTPYSVLCKVLELVRVISGKYGPTQCRGTACRATLKTRLPGESFPEQSMMGDGACELRAGVVANQA